MQFEQLSEWIIVDDYCGARVIAGGNPDNVSDRIAFIEKTPRVRLLKNQFCIEKMNEPGCVMAEQDAWLPGPKGSSEYGRDKESRAWCDEMLKLLGWR